MSKKCTLLYKEKFTDTTTNKKYAKVEYIQTDGKAYINSNVLPNENTRVVQDFEFRSFGTMTNIALFGQYSINNSVSRVFVNPSRVVRVQWRDGYPTISYTYQTNVRTIVDMDGKNKQFKINGTSLYTLPNGTINGLNPIGLFVSICPDIQWTGDFIARMYNAQIYQDGTNITRDFVPVKNIETNEYGLFDRVNNKFYGNAGAGAFTGGEVEYYEEVEYIESSGTQYIDTGTKLNNNTKVELKLEFTTTSYTGTAVKIFGSRNGADVNNIVVASNISLGQTNQATLDFNNSVYAPYRTARNITSNIIYNIVLSKEERSVNGEGNFVLCPDTIQTPTNAYIFNASGNAYGDKLFVGRVYSCKFLENNIFVRDFIPVKNKITNEYGLFDRANNKFYQNEGTGVFTGGNIKAKIVIGGKSTHLIKNIEDKYIEAIEI